MIKRVFLLLVGLYCFSPLQAMDVFFESRPIQEVLPWLAAKMNKSLVISPKIDDVLTLSIKNATWKDVINAVSKEPDISLQWQNGVAVLMPASTSQATTTSSQSCQRSFWMLRNAKAKKVGKQLKTLYPKMSIVVDDRTNSIITYSCNGVSGLTKTLAWLDVPLRQIEISARIAQVSTSAQSQFGVNWQANLADSVRTSAGGAVDLGALAPTSQLSFANHNGLGLLSFTLDMLESEGLAKVLSKPKVVASEGEKARIESGTEVPYQTVDDDNVKVEFRQAALVLEVTPYVKEKNRISLKLTIHQDSVGDLVNGVPSIKTNIVRTQVVVKDQETLVLGGIFRKEKFTTNSQVPLLGDIPYLGALFKKHSEQEEKVELLVFITPKLLQMSVN